MRNEADDVASGIIAKWSNRFTRLDADGLASLYSRHAFFFGSNPTLYRGREGVEAYFNGLPRWHAPTVQFAEVKTAMVGSDVINMAAIASFFLREGEPPLSVKISWVIVREDDDWKIVSHHVSSRNPLIDGAGQ